MQIREQAEATPDKPAVILYPSGTAVTFGELEARANQLAHLFRAHGLREGDVVAVLMENNEHYHAVMWGARRSGLYYVPINTHLTAAEAAYIIDNSGAKAIIGSTALGAVLGGLAEHLPDGLPEVRMVVGGELDGWLSYPECLADQPVTPIADEIEGDLLQYSSGTTGRPKGIKRDLPHLPPSEAPGLMTALVSFWANPDGVYLSPAPLYHTAPNVWSMTFQAAGIPVVVMERFDAEGTLDAIQRHRITHGQFVPVMFTRMLKLPQDIRNAYDVSSLERVMHAAAPCPVEIKKQMIDWWGPIVDEYYASSEAHRLHPHQRRGMARPSGLRRTRDGRRRSHSRRARERTACRRTRRDLLRDRRDVRVPQRPGQDRRITQHTRLANRRRYRIPR